LCTTLSSACALEPTGLVGLDAPKGLLCPSGVALEAQSFDGLGLGLSRDGRFFARYTNDRRVVLVDRCDGREDVLPTELLFPVSISGDGERVALTYEGRDSEARVGIFSRSGVEVASAPSAAAPVVRLSADGSTLAHLALCSEGSALCPVLLREGSTPRTLPPPPGGLVRQLASTWSGDRLLFANPGGVWLWDVSSSARLVVSRTDNVAEIFIHGEGSNALVVLQHQTTPLGSDLRSLDLETRELGAPLPGVGLVPLQPRVDDALRFMQGWERSGSAGQLGPVILDLRSGERLHLTDVLALSEEESPSSAILSGDGAWIALDIFVPSQDSNWGQRIQLIPNPFFAAR
jgi:hypothetical protein